MSQEIDSNPSCQVGQAPEVSPPIYRRLIDKRSLFELLGIKERKFDEMDAAGLIPPAKFIGPRTRRWVYPDDFDTVLSTLATAKKLLEPPTLAAGRRRRIEAIKAGQGSRAAG